MRLICECGMTFVDDNDFMNHIENKCCMKKKKCKHKWFLWASSSAGDMIYECKKCGQQTMEFVPKKKCYEKEK